jgi:hypothetical protein
MVRSGMPSSSSLKFGDHVAVPWGVDTRQGEIVAIYRTGDAERVVVRLTVPDGDGDESPTVELPATSVIPLSEAGDLPTPGSWLVAFRYEQEVAEAFGRVLADLQPTVRLNVERSGREIDILAESDWGTLIVEVKSTDNLSALVIDSALRQLRAAMDLYPNAKGLLITSGSLPVAIGERARTKDLMSSGIGIVRWRGPGDDKNLASIVHALLEDGPGKPGAAAQ